MGTQFFNDNEKDVVTLHPSKINIIVGSNGSYKTSFLEALSLTLLGVSKENPNQLLSIISTLGMDYEWFYFFAKNEVDMSVDTFRLTNLDGSRVGVSVKKVNSECGAEIYVDNVYTDINGTRNNVYTSRTPCTEYYDFIAFSLPNPITPYFVTDFLSLINPNVINSIKLIEEELDYKFLGFYPDDLGRNSIILADKNGEINNIRSLGSGISALVFLILATVHDIVIYDVIENYLHPQLMFKLIDVIKKSNSQWFFTTYSLEFIEYLISSINEKDLQIWRFRKDKKGVIVDVYKGKEVDDVINTLKIDLRS